MNLSKLISEFDPRLAHEYHPYVIAEAGVNHECDIDLALRQVDEAKEGGAQAIKFQTYTASKLASRNSPSYWDLKSESTDSQFKLFSKYDKFGHKEFGMIKKHCDAVGIEFLSTPFDVESAIYINEMVDVIKISSSDLNNKPYVEFLCSFNKPILLSTGASYMWEVAQTLEWINRNRNPVCLMHCVLSYPTPDESANLLMIKDLAESFPYIPIGYSDHTVPADMMSLELAYLLGAVILEKHFTHDKKLPGNDHYHAMDKIDLRTFRERISRARKLMGNKHKEPLASEFVSRTNARRSLVAKADIKKGEIVAIDKITWKRPGLGIDPRDFDSLIGKVAREDIKEDDVLSWGMFL